MKARQGPSEAGSRRRDRRGFLKQAGALSVPLLVPATALSQADRPPASERIVMATIGCGGQGTGDMRGFMGHPEVQMVAVCDPVPEHRERARNAVNEKYRNKDCKAYNDFREVLARPDIDAVLIGTPDHWHAIITIEACRHGKDIYCEKPESLTIARGPGHGRGGQPLWPGLLRRQPARAGRLWRLAPADLGRSLGEIKEVFVDCGGPSGDCYLPEVPIPAGLDWDMWLGPAPWRPFHPNLIKGGFRPYRDYSGGGMTDWGAHRFGAAMFAVGLHLTGPTDVIPPDGKEHKYLTYRFANGLSMYHGGTNNITYKGTDGELPGKPARPARESDMPTYKGKGGIFGDFLHCVRTREKPFRNIEVAHRACTVCHLGNIAYWLKRPLKWDPVKEEIVGDPEANRWLDRPKREPWSIA